MKYGLLFLLFVASSIQSLAQGPEMFEGIAFQTPKGWQKEVGKESVQFGAENADGGVCLITMFKPIAGNGNSKTDFSTAWENIVQKTVTAGNPQMNPAGNDDGWAIENGLLRPRATAGKGSLCSLRLPATRSWWCSSS